MVTKRAAQRRARRRHAFWLALAAGLGAALAAAGAEAQPRTPAGGPEPLRPRPVSEAARACSFVEPVCVHTAKAVPAWAGRDVLRAAESALSGYRALGLPLPLADASR